MPVTEEKLSERHEGGNVSHTTGEESSEEEEVGQ